MIEAVKYLAVIAAGYAFGKAVGRRTPAFLFTTLVVALVFFVAAEAAEVVWRNVDVFLAVAVAYAMALVLAAAVLGAVLDRERSFQKPDRPAVSAYVATAMAAGLLIGGLLKADYAIFIDPLLYALLFAAGADMAGAGVKLELSALVAPAVALASAALVAPVFALAFGISPAVAFGLGWYSFTGPYLARAGDVVGGAYGLLVNFLREQFTYVLAPLLARRFGKVGVLAMGGATTMDNTLPLYTALYGSAFSIYAFANGVILTILVPILVPAVHRFYST
ncbi:MAG: LysO family transporter [Pyrobaculum sp.]